MKNQSEKSEEWSAYVCVASPAGPWSSGRGWATLWTTPSLTQHHTDAEPPCLQTHMETITQSPHWLSLDLWQEVNEAANESFQRRGTQEKSSLKVPIEAVKAKERIHQACPAQHKALLMSPNGTSIYSLSALRRKQKANSWLLNSSVTEKLFLLSGNEFLSFVTMCSIMQKKSNWKIWWSLALGFSLNSGNLVFTPAAPNQPITLV